METHAEVLAAMANANRLAILAKLQQGEWPVSILSQAIGLEMSAVSQHLSRLKKAKLVSTRRDGQQIYYRISSSIVVALFKALSLPEVCSADDLESFSAWS